jgi:hypothetical protein
LIVIVTGFMLGAPAQIAKQQVYRLKRMSINVWPVEPSGVLMRPESAG